MRPWLLAAAILAAGAVPTSLDSVSDLITAGRYDQAIKILQAVPPSNPDAPFVQLMLGRVYSLEGQWQEAEDTLRRSVQMDPTFDLGYVELAGVQSRHGDPNAALATLQTACTKLPTTYSVHLAYARALEGDHQISAAREEFHRAEDMANAPVEALVGEARDLAATGSPREAWSLFNDALTLDPEDPDALESGALAEADAGRLPESTAMAGRLESVDSVRAARLYNEMADHLKFSDEDAADRFAQKAHALDGRYPPYPDLRVVLTHGAKRLPAGAGRLPSLFRRQDRRGLLGRRRRAYSTGRRYGSARRVSLPAWMRRYLTSATRARRVKSAPARQARSRSASAGQTTPRSAKTKRTNSRSNTARRAKSRPITP